MADRRKRLIVTIFVAFVAGCASTGRASTGSPSPTSGHAPLTISPQAAATAQESYLHRFNAVMQNSYGTAGAPVPPGTCSAIEQIVRQESNELLPKLGSRAIDGLIRRVLSAEQAVSEVCHRGRSQELRRSALNLVGVLRMLANECVVENLTC